VSSYSDCVTRSHSRVAARFELNCSLGNSVNQLDMSSPEVVSSELLKAIDKLVRSIDENKVTLAGTKEFDTTPIL
jgi:hypothetical protein